ncbi:MAG: hypothetical protein AB7P21_07065 [Lautropia sp.]
MNAPNFESYRLRKVGALIEGALNVARAESKFPDADHDPVAILLEDALEGLEHWMREKLPECAPPATLLDIKKGRKV